VKLKVDENLPSDVAVLLRAATHDVETVDSEGLTGAPDERVAEACRTEKRALLTLDTDFGNLRAYPPAAHAGLIVLRPSRQDKASVLQMVSKLLPFLETEPVEGRLWIFNGERLRVRE
jgi:predicted nuclease of predicted toxin-antitoxin system